MSVDYLRISVTNRCNLKCIYCGPSGTCHITDCEEALTIKEIKRAAGLLAACGIRKVRVTGGEPLLREDIAGLIHALSEIAGIEDLSLTTNGVLLGPMADDLKAAGLHRINVSIDSMDRETYRRITGCDRLSSVIEGIHKALEACLSPVKLNSVIMKGINDSDRHITALSAMSVHLPIIVRFIEYCPTSAPTHPAADYVPNSTVRTLIEREFGPLSNVATVYGSGPALYFKIRNSAGAIGFINGRSSVFCRSCSRVRMSSDGKLMPCLFSAQAHDLGRLMRSGATDIKMSAFLKTVFSEKCHYTKLNSLKEDFCMCGRGG